MSEAAAEASLRVGAAEGLCLEAGADGAWRVLWRGCDWLGPLGLWIARGGGAWSAAAPAAGARAESGEDDLGPWVGVEITWPDLPLPVTTRVRGYAGLPLLVFRLEAGRELRGLATGSLARPGVAWWWRPAERSGALPEGTRSFTHQYTEFASPRAGTPDLDGLFLFPHRPAVGAPLWLDAPDASLMLAPLDGFHEQVLAPPADDPAASGLRCGWHGDLDSVPAGYATELALWAGAGHRAVVEAWGACLLRRHGTVRPSRHADAALARLSYWTDNGAAYWYRTEPGRDVPETLEGVAASLREQSVPVHAFELDSWFYPHEHLRPIDPEGAELVPPSGMLAWEAREDALPEGVAGLRRRLGDAPLILHSRHFSSRSPYFQDAPAWTDGDRAHPQDPELFARLVAQAAGWGAAAIEQDWLVELYLGVRGVRERPGRTREWQEEMNRAAREHGLSLVWCMASPADFFQTVTLDRVSAIRTSGDYRYLSGNAVHWTRFLMTNALARALGLWPFKDVFLSDPDGQGWDGDEHAEAEALISALSAGPVGIGDRIGRTRREIVMRTCRSDGVLVKPDVPIAALDRCFRQDPFFEPAPLVGETWSDHPAGRWTYLAAFNAWRGREPLSFRVALEELGEARPRGPVLALDWRSGRCERLAPDAVLSFEMDPDAWDYRILCPLLPGDVTVFGDTSLYASAGDRRLRRVRSEDGGVAFDVLGAPGEALRVDGWCAAEPTRVEVSGASGFEWSRDPGAGRWRLALRAPDRGWAAVRIRP